MSNSNFAVLVLLSPIMYHVFGAALVPSIFVTVSMCAVVMKIYNVELTRQKNLFNFLLTVFRLWVNRNKPKKVNRKK